MRKLRAPFEIPAPLTVGVEEEVMLVDAASLDLAPRARSVLEALGADPRFKLEMPAAHLEIVLPPMGSAGAVEAALAEARRDLAAACSPLGLRPVAAGVHPFAAPLGEVNGGERYESMVAEFGDVARAQLVCALQVHVAVRPADRAMAVYNALRPLLPLVSALAANGPIFEGRDTGLASARPGVCTLLPQQGMPPALTWEAYDEALARLSPARWWWELRPHPQHGTLEVRAPDSQTTVEEAAAVVAVVHALVASLADSAAAPRAPSATPADSALGADADLERDRRDAYEHGSTGPLSARLLALLDALEPVAAAQGTSAHLATARRMAASGGGAGRQRAVFARHGARAVVSDLAERFLGT